MSAQHDSPKAVLLDVGGTLIESRPSPAAIYADVLSRRGETVTEEEVAPAFKAVWTELTLEHPPGLDRYHHLKGGEWEWWGTFLRRVLDRLGHRTPWEPVLAELFETFADPTLWHVFPEVREVLDELRGRGLRLAVVSNWDARLPTLLADLGLADYFEQLLVSGIEGVEKPAVEIFHRAARRLGVENADCVHIGDSPLDDVRGAEAAGMSAVLLDRHRLFADGFVTIEDLRGVYAIV